MHARSVFAKALRGQIVLALSLVAPLAGAQSSLDGKWKQGPVREEFTVHQWLPGCGPAPVSGSSGGGEIIQVHEEGDELSFIGGGRVFKTNECYDQLPTLVRDSHSRDGNGRSWRTRCSTPPADPRRGLMQTLVSVASDTHIELTETGRYEISLKEGRCIADVKRSRGFDLVPAPTATGAGSTPPPPKARPTHAPEPVSNACATPGEPARLEVHPSRKLLRTGETFTFQAVVRDAAGCNTPTSTTWAVSPSSDTVRRLTIEGNGKVTVAADAPEGVTDIVVSAAGKSARVTVDVSSPAHYDSLLSQSGLNALGENDDAVVTEIATGSLGGRDAKAEGNAARRRTTFIAIVSTIAAVLGIIALVGWRRSKRAIALEREANERHEMRVYEAEARRREKAAKHAAQMKAHEESVQRAVVAAKTHEERRAEDTGALACPACRHEYPNGTTFCPADGNRLVGVVGHEGMLSGPGGGICPTCKRGFDPGVTVCPADGDELVPHALRGAVVGGLPHVRGKICPSCGGRFEGSATFCGKDGTALVLLN